MMVCRSIMAKRSSIADIVVQIVIFDYTVRSNAHNRRERLFIDDKI